MVGRGGHKGEGYGKGIGDCIKYWVIGAWLVSFTQKRRKTFPRTWWRFAKKRHTVAELMEALYTLGA